MLGERRQTAYQRLINPWRVICTVRPLRIGIKKQRCKRESEDEEKREEKRWGSGGRGGWSLREGGREEKRLALDETSSIVIKQEFPLSL